MRDFSGDLKPDEMPKADPIDPSILESLFEELTSKDALRRQKARLVLIDIGSPAVPHLIEFMTDKRDWLRWEAAKCLGEIRDEEAIPQLVQALRDKMFEVRWLAADGLINIGWRSITPLIESLIDHANSIWMRDGAHHVLHDLSHGRFKVPLKPILKSLEGIEPAVEIPLVGRTVLEVLIPIEAQIIREEQEAEEKARQKAEMEAKFEADMEGKLEKELGSD